MFQQAIEGMGAVLDTVPVSYTQSGNTATINVCLGSAEKDQDREHRVANIDKRADILLAVSAFESAFGEGKRPKDTDSLTMHGKTWKVRPLMGGGPSWRYSDPQRLRIRIHLLEVS